MSALVLAAGLRFGTWWYVVLVGLVVVGEGIVVGAYRRVSGVWTTSWDAFPRWAVWLGFGAGLALVGAAAAVTPWTGLVWPVWVLAAVMLVCMVALGRWTDVVWRTRLRAVE